MTRTGSDTMSSLVVEIFRSDDYVPDGEIPLVPVLGAVFADVIGRRLGDVVFELYFYQIMDLTPDQGTPAMENLRSSHGFVRVRILRDGELIYQHPHPVRELIGEPLRGLLRKRDPAVTHWGYGVRGPGLEAIALSRPAPRVAHEVRVPTGSRRRVTFTVEEEPEPEPPEASLAALGGPGRAAAEADGQERASRGRLHRHEAGGDQRTRRTSTLQQAPRPSWWSSLARSPPRCWRPTRSPTRSRRAVSSPGRCTGTRTGPAATWST